MLFISVTLSPKLKCGHYLKQLDPELSEEIIQRLEKVKLHVALFLGGLRHARSQTLVGAVQAHVENYLQREIRNTCVVRQLIVLGELLPL